jgi:hypothetical protein
VIPRRGAPRARIGPLTLPASQAKDVVTSTNLRLGKIGIPVVAHGAPVNSPTAVGTQVRPRSNCTGRCVATSGDWVTIIIFVVVALVASMLTDLARSRAAEAY